jgi:hypothetical protein
MKRGMKCSLVEKKIYLESAETEAETEAETRLLSFPKEVTGCEFTKKCLGHLEPLFHRLDCSLIIF